MKIKTGDKVKVIAGRKENQGQTGKVLQVLKNEQKNQAYVVVEGVNLRKKHLKSRKQGEKGQTIELASPIHISNVMLIDPKSDKPTRVGYKVEGDKKVRVAKVSGEIID
jgi:large subunit ribosomal protein L24